MSTTSEQIAQNYRAVVAEVHAACLRAGRRTSSVTIVAVTKYAQFEWVKCLAELDVREFGESRPQQLVARASQLDRPAHWHLIGPLQRNKVRQLLPHVSLIHSVESVRLLQQIDRIAGEEQLRPRLLLEVNLIADPEKHGFSEAALIESWPEILKCGNVQISGLMTMAAFSENPEDARPTFQRLRTLRDWLQSISPPGTALPDLSMGMSGDFGVAIEEGATLIRIGSALWEGLDPTESSTIN